MPTLLFGGVNAYRKQADPTVRSVPLVASNPEAGFFDRLKDFRFADGGAFDFRGERNRSVGGKFAPHFGRTLKSLNDAVTERVSDHSPMMVDLPLGEPRLVRGERRRAAKR